MNVAVKIDMPGNVPVPVAAPVLAVEDRVRVLPTALDVRGRYVGFPRSDAGRDKAERLGAVLRRMHAEGRIAAILRHRLGG